MTKTQIPPTQLVEVLNRWAKQQNSPVGQVGTGRYSALIRNQRGIQPVIFYATNIDEALLTLTLLAIETGFVPWLKLVAGTDYTGAGAARAKLQAMGYGSAV